MKAETYEGKQISEMTKQELIKALYTISSENNSYNHVLANEILSELKWMLTAVEFEEFKKELFKDFSGFYNSCVKSVMVNISSEIINHK